MKRKKCVVGGSYSEGNESWAVERDRELERPGELKDDNSSVGYTERQTIFAKVSGWSSLQFLGSRGAIFLLDGE